jgi:stage II sporulation protein AA (anti-sigma F factor antagonist)
MSAPPESSWFEVERVGRATVVRFTLRAILDVHTIEAIGEHLFRLAEGDAPQLVLNFRQVQCVVSVMLAKIIMLHRKVETAGGQLGVCHINPDLYEVFEVFKLPQFLLIFDDEGEALKAFNGP